MSKSFILFIIYLFFFILYSLSINSYSSLFISLFQIFIAIFFIKITFPKEANSISIFYLYFTVFSLYMLITNHIFVRNPFNDYFVALDSTFYYKEVTKYTLSHNFYDTIISITNDKYNSSFLGYAYLLSFLNLFSYWIDSPHIIVLKYNSVIFGSLIIVTVFHILLQYMKNKEARKGTMIFAFISPVLFYSSLLLRDIHIMFFFTIMFYMVIQRKKSYFTFFKIILLSYIVYLFRPEHGYFSAIFILYFFWYKFDKYKYFKYTVTLLIIIILFIGAMRLSVFNLYEKTSNNYTNRSIKYANKKASSESGSIGAKLYSLPAIPRTIILSVYSQLIPFPFWFPFVEGSSHSYWRFPEAISGIFWLLVWFFVIWGMISRNIHYPQKIYLMLLIPILLILFTTSEIGVRRMMGAYPIVFVLGYYSYLKTNIRIKHYIIYFWFITYFSLSLFYIFIKYRNYL